MNRTETKSHHDARRAVGQKRESAPQAFSPGLEGVVACETRLSEVRGDLGRLVIAGRPVAELAGHPFEQVCALLWGVERVELGASRVRAFECLEESLLALDAMDCLRAQVARLPSKTTNEDLTATIGVVAAAWVSARAGASLLPPDPSLSHAHDLLRCMRAGVVSDAKARALNAYMATVVDHGLNASTFAARVVASTRSDRVSAIVAAIGALKGPLHGGAPGPVLDMLDAVARTGDADAWVSAELAAGRRIMGIGHRVYRARDPRAAVLETVAEQLDAPRLKVASLTEAAAVKRLSEERPDRVLRANVEFATAVLLDALEIPREAFTSVFAASRVAGWCAHFDEQQQSGRMLRPSSRYVGA